MLNYKHLHYFQQVAEAGGISRASERLHVSPQTISTQISELEDRLGVELFVKNGRSLELTETGRLTLQYARDIFTTGAELEAVLRDRSGRGKALEFRVGVADSVSKAVAFHLVEPALELPDPVRLICQEGRTERLLSELGMHRLDLVLADAPVPSTVSVRAYSHRLGATEVAFYAAGSLRERFAGEFPACLNGAPVCIDPALSAQIKLLKHKPQRGSSCPAPDVDAGSCKSGSSRQSHGWRVVASRTGGGARIGP